MKNKKEELLADFLENNLSAIKKQEIEDFFAKNEGSKTEFEESKEIFFAINKSTEKDFDSSKDKFFYDFLSAEKEKLAEKPQTKVIRFYERTYFKYAASVAGLALAFWIGRKTIDNQSNTDVLVDNSSPKVIEKVVEVPIVRVDTIYVATKQLASAKQPNVMNEIGTLKKEIQETKDLLILSMLKKESPSERIQAVNYSYDLQQPDEQVLKALIYTLDYDRNVNVRIAAADAIGRFGNNTNVRDALVKSLLKQQEPTLQISIIDILTKYNERKALPALRLLAEDNSTSEFVRQKAEESTKLLSL
ncbi:MAG: HEAT repeat domain-containing protein [Emticicia sp.]|uniref:HEAT repeat domain-containing protein n=1 Tax=Emticicia sp. TaxID=1930953 RepID=UPI003BA7F557